MKPLPEKADRLSDTALAAMSSSKRAGVAEAAQFALTARKLADANRPAPQHATKLYGAKKP